MAGVWGIPNFQVVAVKKSGLMLKSIFTPYFPFTCLDYSCPCLLLPSGSFPNTFRCNSVTSCLDCNLISWRQSYLTRKSLAWTFFFFFSPYPLPLLTVSPLLCLADLALNKHLWAWWGFSQPSQKPPGKHLSQGQNVWTGVQEKFIIRKWSKMALLDKQSQHREWCKCFCVGPELVPYNADLRQPEAFSNCFLFSPPWCALSTFPSFAPCWTPREALSGSLCPGNH